MGRARVATTAVRRGAGGAVEPRSKPSLVSSFLFFFIFFIFINRGRQIIRLGKLVIYRDLIFEADRLPALVNLFYLSR